MSLGSLFQLGATLTPEYLAAQQFSMAAVIATSCPKEARQLIGLS
jgi:hypothetical protein